jgi:hypothetical protein
MCEEYYSNNGNEEGWEYLETNRRLPHDAATPRSPQYFATSFCSVSRCMFAVSMISLTPLIDLQYSNVSAICASTAWSWFGSHYYEISAIHEST